MSRIYQGGQAEPTYQGTVSNQGFNPNQVAGNERAIKEEGQRDLQDLETQNRERLRDEDMESTTRRAQDQVDQTQLRLIQQQESDRLKAEQQVDAFILQNSQLVARNSLSAKNQKDTFNQAFSQKLETDTLRLKDLEERQLINREKQALQADQNLERLQFQASQQISNANRAIVQSGIQGIIQFANAGFQAYAKNQEIEKKRQEVIAAGEYVVSGGANVILPNGDVNPVIQQEATQLNVEDAQETAIVETNPGNPIGQEQVREPAANATAARNFNQASVGELASRVKNDIWAAYLNPETQITLTNGRTISPAEASLTEFDEVLQSLGSAVAGSYGLEGKDKYAVVSQLVPRIQAAKSEIRARVLPGLINGSTQVRLDAATQNAAGILTNNNDLQGAWNALSSGYWTSGRYNGDRSKANQEAFQQFLTLLDDDQLSRIGDVYKVTNNGVPQPGTKFGDDKSGRFEALIEQEANSRLDEEWNAETRRGRLANLEIKRAENTLTESLINAAGDPEATQLANLQYEQTLRGLKSPEARTALIAAEAAPNSYNPATFAGLRERVSNGEILDKEELREQLRLGYINANEYDSLVGMGGAATTMSDLEATVGKEGLKNADKLIETTIASTLLGQFGGDATLAKAGTASIAADARSRLYPELGSFISNFEAANERKPTQGEISQFVNGWVSNFAATQLSSVDYTPQGGLTGYSYTGNQGQSSVRITTNPVTGREAKGVAGVSIVNLTKMKDSIDISSDYVLTQKEIQDNLKGLESGQWTPSLTAKAKALGVAPLTLLRGQTSANGYGDVTSLRQPQTSPQGSTNQNITAEDRVALDVIGKYESDNVGGYNAINQIGTDNGYGVKGFSGDSRQMPQHGGKSVADMTLGEIMGLQSSRPISDDQWISEGRLHAVGRYQFIGSTLAWVRSEMGLPLDTKFTPDVQDRMALWLLKNSQNGIGQWVGPNAYATSQERSVVNIARQNLIDSNRILKNPNATQAQLRRASKAVGSAGLIRASNR